MELVNRIEIVLFKKGETARLPSVSWSLLEVDIKELLVREYKQYLLSQESK